MHLSKLIVRNFRNYRATTFNFSDDANTIIGENDSGKSNLLTAIRILLDEKYYYSNKSLKESDFNRSLHDWRGHWIIISVEFSGMSSKESDLEVISSMIEKEKLDIIEESISALNGEISNDEIETGNLHLIIRPSRPVRQKLYDASHNSSDFKQVRNSITIDDYDFEYRSRSKIDFSNDQFYEELVGDFENFVAADPDKQQDDSALLGTKININDVTKYISVVYIDALRDALRTMNTPQNPIRKIIKKNEQNISAENLHKVKENIKELNTSITNISQIGDVNKDLNSKLIEILGLIYSPDLSLSSSISDEMTSLSRFLRLKTRNEEDLEFLGLGHLNMIFIALKIVEFDICSKKEVLNIMLLEEPESHIHHHIQKTLFRNLGIKSTGTQVIMTTHSQNIAESSDISKMNIVKSVNNHSIAMNPSYKLDEFGTEKLEIKAISLTKSIERYLDAKRSPLLFSKGVVLVEGDAEEIMIPSLFRNRFGISLDEIGIGLINIGSTSFEYIASLFGDERIKRRCSIITDMDKQAIPEYITDNSGASVKSKLYKGAAEQKGIERKNKLERLFGDNEWVDCFYAETTFEFELAKKEYNLFSRLIPLIKEKPQVISSWQSIINGADIFKRNESILKLANEVGKGWLATMLSEQINKSDQKYEIPKYIIEALVFSSKESMNDKVLRKIIAHVLNLDSYSQSIEEFLTEENESNFPDIYLFVSRILLNK